MCKQNQILCNVCPLYIPLTCNVCMFTVHVHTKPVCSTGVHKTTIQYRCTQNQFTVQVYTKPVYSRCVHITSLQYRCTQNQFTVQVYLNQLTLQLYTNQFIVHVDTKPDQSTLFKFFVKSLSSVEKLAAQKSSFNLIYKYLT